MKLQYEGVETSELINRAITSLMGLEEAVALREKLFQCMVEAKVVEIKNSLKKS